MKPLSLILDLFLPSSCKVCKNPLEYNERWVCNGCFSKIKEIKPPICNRCGRPSKIHLCSECQMKRRYLKRSRAYGIFEGVLKEVIHLFKYGKKVELSNVLGDLMCKALERCDWDFEYIVPVPLHKKKEHLRTFNQTKLLADFISKKRGIPIFHGLKKSIDTPSQVGLSYNERRTNILDCFSLKDNKKIEGKSLLLIDDVMTTGTTIEECSRTLLEGGAKEVYGLCIAYAV